MEPIGCSRPSGGRGRRRPPPVGVSSSRRTGDASTGPARTPNPRAASRREAASTPRGAARVAAPRPSDLMCYGPGRVLSPRPSGADRGRAPPPAPLGRARAGHVPGGRRDDVGQLGHPRLPRRRSRSRRCACGSSSTRRSTSTSSAPSTPRSARSPRSSGRRPWSGRCSSRRSASSAGARSARRPRSSPPASPPSTPSSCGSSSHFWAETLFTRPAVVGDRADDGGRRARLAAARGRGRRALRPRDAHARDGPLLPPRRRALARRGGAPGACGARPAFLAASLAVVVPWTVRNYLAFDAFVPVSTSGALNLWQGNTRMTREQVYEEYWAVHGRIAKYEHARRRGIEAVLERQPWWIFEKLRDEMPEYWAAHGAADRAHRARRLRAGAQADCLRRDRRGARCPTWPCSPCSWPASPSCPRDRVPVLLLALPRLLRPPARRLATGTRATGCRRCRSSSSSRPTA